MYCIHGKIGTKVVNAWNFFVWLIDVHLQINRKLEKDFFAKLNCVDPIIRGFLINFSPKMESLISIEMSQIACNLINCPHAKV